MLNQGYIKNCGLKNRKNMTKALINNFDCIFFYDERIPAEKAPISHPHMYHIRHDEDNWTRPITIERFVLVNFFGTVFMKESIEFDSSGYLEIERYELGHNLIEFRVKGALLEKIFGL